MVVIFYIQNNDYGYYKNKLKKTFFCLHTPLMNGKQLIKYNLSMLLLGRYFCATSNHIWVDPVNPLPSKMFIRMPIIHILPISNIILARCNNKIIKYAVKISNVVLMFYFQLKRVSAKLRILYPWSIIFIENTTYY